MRGSRSAFSSRILDDTGQIMEPSGTMAKVSSGLRLQPVLKKGLPGDTAMGSGERPLSARSGRWPTADGLAYLIANHTKCR